MTPAHLLHTTREDMERTRLAASVEDDSLRILLADLKATNDARRRLMALAAGEEDRAEKDTPPLDDLTNPAVWCATVATTLQHQIEALMALQGAMVREQWERRVTFILAVVAALLYGSLT